MTRQLRGLLLSLFVSQRLTMFINTERGSDLAQLTKLIEAGCVTPSVDRVYPLDEAPNAMRHLAAGNVRGKVAISL
jgi:NADPH:quinone reductase-like Zn-dependent oxidoreductase